MNPNPNTPIDESNNRVYQTQLAATASRSTISVPSAQNSGLLHEPPPFSAATSGHGHGSMLGHGGGEAAPASADEPTRSQQLQSKYPYLQQSEARKSGESERLAYEHWYRGDASRNGGVGELRVGTRMEMLEIANYGHKYSKRNSGVVVAKRQVPWVVEEGWRRRRNEMMMMMSRQSSSSTGSGSGSMMSTSISTELAAAAGIGQYQSRRQSLKRGHRPRADSIAGVGTKGREYEFDRERESFYLDDDDDVDGIGRVLDESPLTDIDGEGEFSDIASDSEAHYFHSEERREREFGGFGGVGGPGGGRSFSSSYAQQKHTLAHSPEPIGHEGDSGSGDAHSPSADDARSTTPTPTVKTHRQQSSSSSRNTATTVHHQQTSASTTTGANGNAASGALPPSRIPVPPSRKSTDTTRSPTPTPSILNRVSPEMPPPPLPAAAAANPPRSATPSSLRQNSSSTGIPTTSTLGKNSLSNGSAPGAPTSTSTSGAQPAAVPSTPMKRGTSTSPTPQQQQAPGSTVKSPRKSTTNNTATKANRAKHEAMRREQAEEARRKNKGQYPSLPGGEEDDSSGDGGGERGDGLEHAIPVWTQPVVRGEGGWDDVVLPAVARKKGLDGYYEQKDGRSSGAKRKVEDEMPAPAPGTFGFDHSKIRGPKDSTTTSPTESPLDEFGQQRPNADGKSDSSKEDDSSSKNNSASSEEEATQSQLQRQQEQEQEEEYKPPTTTPHDKIKLPVSRPILASERPPFSDYPAVSEKTVVAITGNGNASTSARANGNAQGEMVMMVDLEKGRNGNGKGDAYEDEEDKGAGCCRCVIM
ncbi:hypothetical protein AX16_008488 [Volvariella volvacea WC 439]|nr:hypothetical protein AX16_008488 [Volvariella volvacea WC 439]